MKINLKNHYIELDNRQHINVTNNTLGKSQCHS